MRGNHPSKGDSISKGIFNSVQSSRKETKLVPVKLFVEIRLVHLPFDNWYFVTKIVLTYCEKKIVLVIEKKLLKFDAEGREFAKI